MSLSFDVTREPDADDMHTLSAGLNQHAASRVGEDGFKPIAVFVRDENGDIHGGVTAYINWNWLQISLLWVDEELRGEGLGSELLSRLEAIAKQEGCERAHVSTFSFQATTFYEAHGFTRFALLEDYPPGEAKHFLKKDL